MLWLVEPLLLVSLALPSSHQKERLVVMVCYESHHFIFFSLFVLFFLQSSTSFLMSPIPTTLSKRRSTLLLLLPLVHLLFLNFAENVVQRQHQEIVFVLNVALNSFNKEVIISHFSL
jgi:hypothetical protein